MITENLSTLKIHKLTQEQYDREKAAGNIDPNALYLTPDEEVDLSNFVTLDKFNNSKLLKFQGNTTWEEMSNLKGEDGDVRFNTTNGRFYLWVLNGWKPILSSVAHTVEDDGTEPVTGNAVYSFVMDAVGANSLHYCGTVTTGSVLAAQPCTLGDVWFVENENGFYMWDGENWKPLGTGSSTGAGADGITPHIGANGNWFIGETDTGVKAAGEKGENGYTPVKGVDYYTETERAELIAYIVDVVNGASIFGYVDENNNIIISGVLDDEDTYTVKYEMEDGSTITIGNLTFGEVEEPDDPEPDTPDEPVASFTNQIPISTDASGNLFVGENGEAGYKSGYRLSMSAGTEKALEGYSVTGFIPAKNGDVIRIKNITVADENNINIAGYDANKQPLNGGTATYGTTLYNVFVTRGTEENGVYTATITQDMHLGFGADLAYIRIGSTSITDESILTVNQPIV